MCISILLTTLLDHDAGLLVLLTNQYCCCFLIRCYLSTVETNSQVPDFQ